MFKVVPDQLRISDGWVRCGQCDEVFDANAHLQPTLDSAPIAVPSEPPEVLDWGGMLDTDSSTTDLHIPLEFPASAETEPAISAKPAEFDPIPSAFAFDAHDRSADVLAPAESSAEGISDRLDAIPREETFSPAGPAAQSNLDRDPVVAPVAVPVAPAVDTPQFLKTQRPGPVRSSWWGRIVWISMSALLVIALVAQVVVQERDRIVATVPAMASWLEPVCQAVGCKISPLKQIESIVIDQSSFSKAQSEGYVLGFAVKSNALTEVAIPSLELTLTDMQDRAVVRRVLSPRELGYLSQVLAPGGEWSGSVTVDVKLAEGSERISGYRLLVFYP
jgi:predicted Zn finger-like uncharacterized protein